MRSVLALLVVGTAFAAEPPRRAATVDIDGASVLSGPALKYPSVAELRKGDSVVLLREEDKYFYAILPPPGAVSWIKGIHLGKVEADTEGKANVPVAVEGAECVAGTDRRSGPTNHITARLPRGTIVEVIGHSTRIDNATWYPITPPDGDVRWIARGAVKASSVTAIAPPAPYVKPDQPTFSPIPSDGSKGVPARTASAELPRVFSEHRLYEQAVRAEKAGEYAVAKGHYARIYQDLWDQKADRDAIVICYNRYTRCEEMIKRGDGPTPLPTRTETPPTGKTESGSRSAPMAAKWTTAGYLQELQKVFVDNQPVYSLQDDRGAVVYYATANDGINLKNFNGKRVQLFGVVQQRPELYRPHVAVEKVELAR